MFRKLYMAFGLASVLTYGWASYRGLELRRSKPQYVAAGARSAGSGFSAYRGGYRGGK